MAMEDEPEYDDDLEEDNGGGAGGKNQAKSNKGGKTMTTIPAHTE